MGEMIQEVLLLWTLKGCRLKKLWTLKERYKWTPGKHHIGPVGVSLDLFVKIGLAEALGIRYTMLRKGIPSSRDLKENVIGRNGEAWSLSDSFSCCCRRNF